MPSGPGRDPRTGMDARPYRPQGRRRSRPLTNHRLDRLDRLELRDLRPPVLPVRRDAHVRPELLLGLVDREALRRPIRDLDEEAAGAAAVHREEVAAVLGL